METNVKLNRENTELSDKTGIVRISEPPLNKQPVTQKEIRDAILFIRKERLGLKNN